MREFKKRHTKQEEMARLGVKTLGVVVLFGFTVLLAHAAWDMYGKLVAASQAKSEALSQLASLEAQQKGVTRTITKLTTERGVEAEVRVRFGVARPGEGEIDIVEDRSSTTSPVGHTPSWWQGVYQTLFVW